MVLHYTAAGHWKGSYRWFAEYPQAKASAHFVVGREGELVHVVPLDAKAWHAGTSCLAGESGRAEWDVNGFSIGFEIANLGLLIQQDDGTFWYDAGGGQTARYLTGPGKYPAPVEATLRFRDGQVAHGWWEPYTEAAFESVALACEVLARHGVPMHRIVGHESVIQPVGKKKDTGPLFPWRRLYERLCASPEFPELDVWRNHVTNVRELDPQLVA